MDRPDECWAVARLEQHRLRVIQQPSDHLGDILRRGFDDRQFQACSISYVLADPSATWLRMIRPAAMASQAATP